MFPRQPPGQYQLISCTMIQWRVHDHFSLENCENIVYTQWPMHRALITQDERPKLIDPPLMPIVMMGHRMWLYLFSQWRRPILWLCRVMTKSLLNYLTYKTNSCGRTVDTDIKNGAGSMWLSLLPKKPANTTLTNGRNWSPCRLLTMQDQKLLKLCWPLFCHGCIHNIFSFSLA